MRSKLTKVCPICRETFGVGPRESRPAFEQRAYCSKPCAGAARQARNDARFTPATKTCEWCSVEFGPPPHDRRRPGRWATRRFCSVQCGVANREANRERKPRSPRKPDTRRRRKPPPELSVFGDRKPAQPWRPAGFSAAPRVGGGSS